jgi:hypothetical protein
MVKWVQHSSKGAIMETKVGLVLVVDWLGKILLTEDRKMPIYELERDKIERQISKKFAKQFGCIIEPESIKYVTHLAPVDNYDLLMVYTCKFTRKPKTVEEVLWIKRTYLAISGYFQATIPKEVLRCTL